jgi:hypothetical protein
VFLLLLFWLSFQLLRCSAWSLARSLFSCCCSLLSLLTPSPGSLSGNIIPSHKPTPYFILFIYLSKPPNNHSYTSFFLKPFSLFLSILLIHPIHQLPHSPIASSTNSFCLFLFFLKLTQAKNLLLDFFDLSRLMNKGYEFNFGGFLS